MRSVRVLVAAIMIAATLAAGSTAVSLGDSAVHMPRGADPRKETPLWSDGAVVAVTYSAAMSRRGRAQVGIELAPNVKEYLEGMVRDGEILSVQDFIRRAIEHELEASVERRRRLKGKSD